MEPWDTENFEPKVVTPVPTVSSYKWEGEDEDDDVKESWEDEEEEEQQKQQEEIEALPKTKKKNIRDIIAEKERLKREEHERRVKEQEEEEEITPEEQIRREKESDMDFALQTTFEGSNSSSTTGAIVETPVGIESMNPNTKEEFQEFSEALTSKLQQLTRNMEFPSFAEDLIRNICVSLSSADLKKIKTTIENLYLEKQKIEKGDKARKSKGKGKAKLKMDNENQYSAYVNDYDEFDDFM